MAIEYLGLSEINGPLVVLEGVKNAAYEEIVEFTIDGKEKKLGRIVEVYEDKAVIQVFEGSDNMSLDNTHTRLTGHPMEIGLSEKILGRTFDGIGNPIDGLGPIVADTKANINGLPLNPVTREYPRNYIRTGISAIDGLTTLIRGQKLPIFSKILSSFRTDIGMPIVTRAFAFLYRYKIISIILYCFSSGTQVSSAWKAFCCKKPRRITRAISRTSFWSSGRTSLPISFTISIRLLSVFKRAMI